MPHIVGLIAQEESKLKTLYAYLFEVEIGKIIFTQHTNSGFASSH
jgi:hypothetical protein